MGLYSKKIKFLKDLPNQAVVAVPNDPTNEYRALALMEKEGLITLKPGKKLSATVLDIATNPKRLIFREIDAAMLPRSLSTVDLAAVPTNFALQAKLNPDKDSLALESKNSPYANIIATRDSDEQDPRLIKLREAMLTDEVRHFILKKYEGAIIPVLELCPKK
jgi:D-methionine transport system substrate-binding protein